MRRRGVCVSKRLPRESLPWLYGLHRSVWRCRRAGLRCRRTDPSPCKDERQKKETNECMKIPTLDGQIANHSRAMCDASDRRMLCANSVSLLRAKHKGNRLLRKLEMKRGKQNLPQLQDPIRDWPINTNNWFELFSLATWHNDSQRYRHILHALGHGFFNDKWTSQVNHKLQNKNLNVAKIK